MIARSVPDSVLEGCDKFFFDSQVKFDKDLYKTFSDKEDRLNKDMV